MDHLTQEGPTPNLIPLRLHQEYNRKNRKPSETMWESDGFHYRCSWIEEGITVHSDGNVSCGLDDPHAQRSFGNVNESSLEEIFRNPEYTNLQNKLWQGHRCQGCGLYQRVEEDRNPSAEIRPRLPRSLVLETTVKCNLRCPNTACIPNNNSLLKTRDVESLDLATVKSVADQLSTSLETIHFYNYGEPFMNRRAEDMLLYLRKKCPGALIVTSTNGIPLSNPSRAENVVHATPDRVIFTMSGITQEVYGIYHVAGKCELALAGLKNICDAKRRNGQTLPTVILRYLVFHWNDSDEQIDGVIALAKEYGVDRLSLYLTDEPPGARSVRFSPGSPSYFKYKKYISFDHLGRLDHLYHCELPDEDGLFPLEEFPGFGKFRKTGSEATLRRKVRRGRLRLAISTDRPTTLDRKPACSIRTPWHSLEVPLTVGKWERVSIRVPRKFRGPSPLEIKVSTDDFWFPAQESTTSDLRCLGVLIRDETLFEDGFTRLHRLRVSTLAKLRRFWHRRLSPTVPGRILSSWNSALADLADRLWPAGTEFREQTPPRLDENRAASPAAQRTEQSLIRMHRTFFGRTPDPDNLKGWIKALLNGSCSLIQIAQAFVSSAEFQDLFGANPTPHDFVTAACRNTFGHTPNPTDCQPWVNFLTENGNSKAAKAATAIKIADSMAVIENSPRAIVNAA
jgi:MoaA/NifB/PqqE/SkfB family radical SAM enzyme